MVQSQWKAANSLNESLALLGLVPLAEVPDQKVIIFGGEIESLWPKCL